MHIYTSPFDDIEIPDCSITEWVMLGLKARAEHPVFIDGQTGRSYTGAQMVDIIQRLAGGLTARGFGASKTIAIMAPNLPEYCAVFHAVAYAGGTVTTLNPTYTAAEVHQQLIDSSAELLVTVPPFLDTARTGIEGTSVTEIAVIGEAEGATPLTSLFGDPLTAQAPVDPASHVVVLPYSSGTTGMPKGVMLTHRNLVANCLQCGRAISIEPGEATVAVLPFFHIYGMTVLMNYFAGLGGLCVTMPRFDMEEFLNLTEAHKVRKLYLVPPIMVGLAKHPLVDQKDLSALEMVMSGAAPLGAELSNAAAQRLGCTVIQGYGMTEMSPVSHICDPRRPRDGASGQTAANTECRIINPETGNDVAPGEAGELLVRGPQVMVGYLNRPQATAECLTDGWLRTGDMGRFDEDGFLFIVDRMKELIKVKGFQVAPAELEAVLLAHPSIGDAAVIGVPDNEAGEMPKAFLVPAPNSEIEENVVRDHVGTHLSSYKQLGEIEVVESIPKSPSGKILRRILR